MDDRPRTMTDRLEDILGGVEDEIRRAEERLQLSVFGVEPTSAAGVQRPQTRPKNDGEGSDEDSSEDMNPVIPARSAAAIRRSRSRGSGGGRLLTSDLPSLGEDLSGRDAARGRARRHVWGSPEHDDLPNDAMSGGGGGGSRRRVRSDGGSGTNDREAMVNRLLRERDARLAARSAGAAEEKGCDHGGGSHEGGGSTGRAAASAHDPRKIGFSRHGSNFCGVVKAIPDEDRGDGCPSLTSMNPSGSVDEGVACRGGGISPSSPRGNIFFASDLLDPIDTGMSCSGSENGENSRAAVDPRELHLRNNENHARVYYDNDDVMGIELNSNEDHSNMISWRQEEDARLAGRPPPPPPPPPPPLEPHGQQSLRNRQAGFAAGRGIQGGADAACSSRPGNPKRHLGVEVGARGHARAYGRGRSTSGSSNSNTNRSEDDSDTVVTARLEEQLAFRPRPGANTRSSLQQNERKPRAGSERRIEELARNRQALYSERERRRKELREEEETKECTFRPKISRSRAAGWGMEEGARYGADGIEGGRPPLHERLHKEAREREAARALAHHHVEKEALRECTFQPTLTTPTAAAAAADPRPLHQRVWEVEREREHKLRLLLAEKEEREGATFAPPPLGRVSEKLAARDSTSTVAGGRGGEGEVLGPDGGRRLATRLQEQAMWARERRRLRIQEHEEAEARVSTFEPTISKGTKSLVRKRPVLQAPFEQRRAIMDAKRQERERLRQAAQAEEETRWFNRPTARRTEALLRRRMPQRLDETVEERVTRMASAEDQRKRDLITAQRAKEKRECTFRPSLNPVSRSLGRAAPLDELVNNCRGQRVRERAKEKARNAQACSHKPVLLAEVSLMQVQTEGKAASRRNGAARGAGAELYGPGNRYRLSVCDPARMTAELRAREREQEERFSAIRCEQEVEEMQRCTFVPQTNPAILRAQGPVLVRGLSRHLELKDIALQRESERRERESQAFGVRPGAVRRSVLGETIVEPFSLSNSDSKGWWRERRARHEAERAAQHTFKPWTVEAERGRALSRLLDWSSALSSESSIRS